MERRKVVLFSPDVFTGESPIIQLADFIERESLGEVFRVVSWHKISPHLDSLQVVFELNKTVDIEH